MLKYIDALWRTTFKQFEYNEGIPNIYVFLLRISPILTLFYYMTFYFLFELYLNLWAEVTKFADRQFYMDFWNISSFSDYGRTWNTITHYFLYLHVFKPCRFRLGLSGVKSGIMTTLVSSMLHDYFAVN